MPDIREVDTAQIVDAVRWRGCAVRAHGAFARGHRVRRSRTEAIRRIELEDFPVWVVNDSEGRDFYAETIEPWRKDELLPERLRFPTDQWAVENGGG